MARSYKKNLRWKMKNDKWFKNYANKVIRRKFRDGEYDVDDGCHYKKFFDKWSICDYNGYMEDWPQYRHRKMNNDHSYWALWRRRVLGEDWKWDDQEEYKNWYRYYKMK